MSELRWRPTTEDDRAAIIALVRECDEHDGTDEASDAPYTARLVFGGEDKRYQRSLCFDASGALVAATGISFAGKRAFLVAAVRPLARSAIEETAVACAVDRAKAIAPADVTLRFDRVLTATADSLPPSTTAVYERLGFEQQYIELEMARWLSADLPEAPALDGISIEHWRAEHDPLLRDAYNEAFSTRGFAGYTAREWDEETFSAQDEFAPEYSFVASAGEQIAGFVMCLCEDDEGWIDSIGVRPAWRGRGIADALLLTSMQAMRDGGMTEAVLRVNVDNPRAIAVYQRLGFQVRRKHEVWCMEAGVG